MNKIEAKLTAPPKSAGQFVIIASRFNEIIVDRLVEGAVASLRRHGVDEAQITLVDVPGAWEIPAAAQKLAKSDNTAAIIALGCVIRGATPHFDYVCSGCSNGLASVQAESGVPVAFGVLTTDSIEQATERAGCKAGNKGAEAAVTAIEMVNLLAQL